MDRRQSLSDAGSANESSGGDDDIEVNSEDDNSLDCFNDDEEQNVATDDEYGMPEMVKTFKHLEQVFAGFSKFAEKQGMRRSSGVQTRGQKNTRNLSHRGKGKGTRAAGVSDRPGTSRGAGVSDRPGSRFDSKYFAEDIIAKLDSRKRKIITDYGFGILLEYDGCSAPLGLVQWISDQVDVDCGDILVAGKIIPFLPLFVQLFLGIPIGGKDIKENYTDSSKKNFLAAIKESSLPTIKSFGDRLVGGELSDEDVFRYFMVVACSTFLCANSNTYPSPQYLEPLVDLDNVKKWDWCKFVHEWTLSSIYNYKKKNRGTIGGCRYFLAGYYLDFVDFGFGKELPLDIPRIKCWKGNMIKNYASLDRVSGHIYGKRPLKSLADSVYADCFLPEEACDRFKSRIESHCADFIPEEVREKMYDIFYDHHTRLAFKSPGTLVAKMCRLLRACNLIIDVPIGDAVHVESSAAAACREECEPDAGRPCAANDGGLSHAQQAAVPSRSGMCNVQVADAAVCNEVIDNSVHPINAEAIGNDVIDKSVEPNNADAVGNEAIANPVDPNLDSAVRNEAIGTLVEPNLDGAPSKDVSVTEIVESDDGLYDAPVDNFCGGSQQTEILPCTNSSAHDNVEMKEHLTSPAVEDGPSHVPPAGHEDVGLNRKRKLNITSVSDPKKLRKMKMKLAATESSPSVEVVSPKVSHSTGTGSLNGKRKSKSPKVSSPGIVSMSPRMMSLRMSTRIAGSFHAISGEGASADNPVVVEANAVESSKRGKKVKASDRSSPVIVSPKSVPRVSRSVGRSPLSRSSVDKTCVQGSAEVPVAIDQGNVVIAIDVQAPFPNLVKNASETVNVQVTAPCVKVAAPYFHSPSMPSFRLFEELDEYGNFVADPSLRRPVGTVSAASNPIDRVISKMKRPATSNEIFPPNVSHVQLESKFNFKFQSGSQSYVLVDKINSKSSSSYGNGSAGNIPVHLGNIITDNMQTDFVHMESLPFTEYSDINEDAIEPVPLEAISPTEGPLNIVYRLPWH